MNVVSDVSKCANPECGLKFVRLGEGELFPFSVSDPKEWGLPPHTRQKVYWLCDKCCTSYYIRLDRRHKSAQVIHRPAKHNAA